MMKKIGCLLILILTINSAWAQESNAIISFEKKKHDFGKINLQKDSTVSVVFPFENIGNSPLIVQKVTSSCGCTIPEWTQSPVETGKKGQIKVIFNAKGFSGKFSKSIYVKSNAKEDVVILKIEGEAVEETDTGIFNLFKSKRKS